VKAAAAQFDISFYKYAWLYKDFKLSASHFVHPQLRADHFTAFTDYLRYDAEETEECIGKVIVFAVAQYKGDPDARHRLAVCEVHMRSDVAPLLCMHHFVDEVVHADHLWGVDNEASAPIAEFIGASGRLFSHSPAADCNAMLQFGNAARSVQLEYHAVDLSYDIEPNLPVSRLVLVKPSAGRAVDMITDDEKDMLYFMQHMKVSGVGEGRSRRRLDGGA